MIELKVRKVGNSLVITLPAKAAQALRVQEGDTLFLTETPDGYVITPYDPSLAETLGIAEDFMKRYRNALGNLAKGSPRESARRLARLGGSEKKLSHPRRRRS